MSIDFTKLQSLETDRGAVVEITDASGRVIWSAKKNVVGTLYMRPSVDISLEHRVYPSGLSAGYLAISEEVSDGSTTYIYVETDTKTTNPSEVEATSIFGLTISKDVIVEKILVARLMCDIRNTVNDENERQKTTCSLIVNGVEVCTGYILTTVMANGEEDRVDTLTGMDMSVFISTVNQYIQENGGNLPSIYLKVHNYAKASGTVNSALSGLTRAYIGCECEYVA